MDILFNVTKFY